ncbi:hypothetical protein [Mariprofundus ferrooxydans]|uniref:hypothetical protein n=1 Tax=Mariprofundus ferrooxydans TaxID=314344 RepID=UPI00142FC496|nr:hypothetical protein [Mariprofundus ferrooxydans]
MASKSHIKVTLTPEDLRVLRVLAERHDAPVYAVLQEIVRCALDVARERLTPEVGHE